MAEVYCNSLCTIAAQSSTSIDSGCFAVRKKLNEMPLVWKGTDEKIFRTKGASLEDSYSNLKTRGWVFQERLPSPRTLIFSSTGISWECREKPATENHYEGHLPSCDSATAFNFNETMGEVARPLLQPLTTAGF